MIAPPRERAGQGVGPRRFDGELLDVRGAAAMLGTSEKLVRSRVERRLIPFSETRWKSCVSAR